MKENFVQTSDFGLLFTKDFFEFCLRRQLNDPELTVTDVSYIPSTSEKMALELKHPKKGDHPIGVQRYNLSIVKQHKKETLSLIVKSKIGEQQYLQAITQAFEKCGIITSIPLLEYMSQLEFMYVNSKEIAVYDMQKEHLPFRKFMPTCYGYYLDEEHQICVLMLHYLSDDYLSLDPFDVEKWNQEAIDYFIDTISQLHAVWYDNVTELSKISYLQNVLDASKMQAFLPYWQALAKAVETADLSFLQDTDHAFHYQLINDIPKWRPHIDRMKKTLVQNDCVPKNVGLKLHDNVKEVYIFDWEITTIHIPQRDSVEFLAYVLPGSFDNDLLNHYINRHRQSLALHSQENIDKEEWRLGFLYSAYDYLIQRVFPQLVFEKLEARNIEKIYKNTRRIIKLLS
ncbi:hypothetical protein [Legionella hackeliae]|uniref:Aminoglycoside phosphotransferase domain-containing protein n=1 Tax=Legionella hackeliae TaxID=449 RepID=A0A0A8UKF6_LEGHA|nr:hypothetical protein [Legionella hackeliae]KTD13510.1 3-hydroxy-3-methylglutaryl coenzyme A reductase-like protein [Legionella hackeliae]CEK09355.1 conserved protein of unknown function [Legionella hackeliae]STX49261.1 3-hydroxy-3-methylglutaryl coenzyme A reductase-like protein [Legionella hackeliae]